MAARLKEDESVRNRPGSSGLRKGRSEKLSINGNGLVTPSVSSSLDSKRTPSWNKPNKKELRNERHFKQSVEKGRKASKKIRDGSAKNKQVSRIGMRMKKKRNEALQNSSISLETSSKQCPPEHKRNRKATKKRNKAKCQIVAHTNENETQDNIRALIQKVADEFDKKNSLTYDGVEIYSDKTKSTESEEIFEARRIVNSIKIDLMSVGDQADSKGNDIIKDNVVDVLGNNDMEKEEEDINRRTKLLQYEMQELKMRKIHLYMNKYKKDLQSHAIQTYKNVDFGSKDHTNAKISLLRQDCMDRCAQLKLLENELTEKINLLGNIRRNVETQRLRFLESCKTQEASIEMQRLNYVGKFKEKLLAEINQKLYSLIESNSWVDLVCIKNNDKPDDNGSSEKKISISPIIF